MLDLFPVFPISQSSYLCKPTAGRMQAFERMRSVSFDLADHLINANEASDRGLFRHTVLIVSVFVAYCVFGMIVYMYALGWNFLDALYFIVITFSTVGYGDLDPKTPAEKLFTSFYLLVGLLALTTLLSVHLALVAEHNEAVAAERSKRTAAMISEKVPSQGLFATVANGARQLRRSISSAASNLFGSRGASPATSIEAREKTSDVVRLQRELLDQANNAAISGGVVESPLVAQPMSLGFNTTSSVTVNKANSAARAASDANRAHETAVAGSGEQTKTSISLEGGSTGKNPVISKHIESEKGSTGHKAGNGGLPEGRGAYIGMTKNLSGRADMDKTNMGALDNCRSLSFSLDSTAEQSAQTRHIETMQQIMMDQWDEDIQALRRGVTINFFIIVIIVIIGFLGMMKIEGWSLNTSFYWACQTITTVGYGDVPPTGKGGKTFTIFYIIFGIGFVARAIGDIVKYPLMLRSRHIEEKVLKQFGGDLSDEKLKMIFHSDMYERNPSLRFKQDEMSKMEFIVLVLEMMNKVEEKDILLVSKIFDRLDLNGDGALNQEDMQLIRAAAQVRDIAQLKREQQRRAEEEAIRAQQQEDANSKSMVSAFTGQMYDMLSSIGKSGAAQPTPSDVRNKKEEDLLIPQGKFSGGSGDLSAPLKPDYEC